MESLESITNLAELAYAQCACVLSAGKMANLMYGHPRKTALDLRNAWVLEKTPQIFRPSSPAKFVTVFLGRTDAPEVRCDLTDTHTHTDMTTTVTLTHARRGLIRIRWTGRFPGYSDCLEQLVPLVETSTGFTKVQGVDRHC